MGKVITLALLVCLAGCVVTAPSGSAPSAPPSSPPVSPTTAPAMCGPYAGGYAACMGGCSFARITGAAMISCPDACTPGAPGEPLVCQKQLGCEAMQEAQASSSYASCMGQCDAMPMECR